MHASGLSPFYVFVPISCRLCQCQVHDCIASHLYWSFWGAESILHKDFTTASDHGHRVEISIVFQPDGNNDWPRNDPRFQLAKQAP